MFIHLNLIIKFNSLSSTACLAVDCASIHSTLPLQMNALLHLAIAFICMTKLVML
jgi:hypothetical protein